MPDTLARESCIDDHDAAAALSKHLVAARLRKHCSTPGDSHTTVSPCEPSILSARGRVASDHCTPASPLRYAAIECTDICLQRQASRSKPFAGEHNESGCAAKVTPEYDARATRRPPDCRALCCDTPLFEALAAAVPSNTHYRKVVAQSVAIQRGDAGINTTAGVGAKLPATSPGNTWPAARVRLIEVGTRTFPIAVECKRPAIEPRRQKKSPRIGGLHFANPDAVPGSPRAG